MIFSPLNILPFIVIAIAETFPPNAEGNTYQTKCQIVFIVVMKWRSKSEPELIGIQNKEK